VRIWGLTLANGHTPTDGGAIENWGALTVSYCVLTGNKADGSGGAILSNGQQSSLKLAHTLFRDNSAGSQGGGGWNGSAALSVRDCTFAGNSASGAAGALMYSPWDGKAAT